MLDVACSGSPPVRSTSGIASSPVWCCISPGGVVGACLLGSKSIGVSSPDKPSIMSACVGANGCGAVGRGVCGREAAAGCAVGCDAGRGVDTVEPGCGCGSAGGSACSA